MNGPISCITGTIPVGDYVPVGIVHGHAETLDPAPLSDVAGIAVQGMANYAATLGADLVIDVHTSVTGYGLEGMRVLATGTAVKIRFERLRDQYAHLLADDHAD